MTSPKRQQLPCLGSPNKNPMYIDKVQRAVEGRVISLIMGASAGKGHFYFKCAYYIVTVNA